MSCKSAYEYEEKTEDRGRNGNEESEADFSRALEQNLAEDGISTNFL